MNDIVDAIVTILTAGLITNVPIEDRIVQVVQKRPEAWVRANLKTFMYPAVFVWADGDELIQGRATRDATSMVRVTVTVMTSSTDPDAASGGVRSSPVIGETAKALLTANKRLVIDSVNKADGLTLPIRSQAFQYTDKGAFYALGWVTMYVYRKFGINWVSEANAS